MFTKEKVFGLMKEAGLDEKKFRELLDKEHSQLSDEELEQVNGGFADKYYVQSVFKNGNLTGYSIKRYSLGATFLKEFGSDHPTETVFIQGDEAAMKKWLGDHASRFDSIFIDKKMVQRSWL